MIYCIYCVTQIENLLVGVSSSIFLSFRLLFPLVLISLLRLPFFESLSDSIVSFFSVSALANESSDSDFSFFMVDSFAGVKSFECFGKHLTSLLDSLESLTLSVFEVIFSFIKSKYSASGSENSTGSFGKGRVSFLS